MNELNNLTIDKLFSEVKKIVDQNRQQLANAVNTFLTSTYWHIGKTIGSEVLNNKRAEYGKQILPKLSGKLTAEYGKGWSVKQLQHCLRFAETFPDFEIVSTLWRQLSWSHLKVLMYQETELKKNFYTQMCRIERWSTRQDLEHFILELGIGFTFIARQKRMSIDNIDHYLDLLFYHRKLKRLIAIELKIGKFKAAYKGQMELYLR